MTAEAGYLMIGIKDSDVVYSPMPLYHLATGGMATGLSILMGCTVVLKKKLSISQYWRDCVRHNVTVGRIFPCH